MRRNRGFDGFGVGGQISSVNELNRRQREGINCGQREEIDRRYGNGHRHSVDLEDDLCERKEGSDNSENETIGDLLSQTDVAMHSVAYHSKKDDLSRLDDGNVSVISERTHIMYQSEELAFDAIYK